MHYTGNLEVLLSERFEKSSQFQWGTGAEQDRAGQLGITNGELRMVEPRGNGAWPVIVPNQGVQVYYRGQLITTPTVIDSAGDISLEAVQKSPKSEFELVVSHDKMEVVLKTRFYSGTEYKVQDSDFVQKLIVKAEPVREISPKSITPALVLNELAQRGIKAEIDRDLIIAACTSLQSQDVVIAKGYPVKPPVDGEIEIVCELKPRVYASSQGDRVNYLDQGEFNSVSTGDVLGYWHPPVPGKAGQDVYGNIVQPRAPKNARFRIGKGVKLIKDGTIAVAEITGRPSYNNGVLRVSPQLVISKDVSLATGNVEFKGDVTVVGNVVESLTIQAGGEVDVLNSAYHANILAGSNITIRNQLIGGSVIAGGQQPGLAKAAKLLQQANLQLERLHLVCSQLKEHPRLSVSDLKLRGDGYLIKLVLETRFPDLSKKFTQVTELLSPKRLEFCDDETIELAASIRHHAQLFLGSAPLEIEKLSELVMCTTSLKELTDDITDLLVCPADITVHYGQNAKLEATGDITVTGPLFYDCDVVAGKSINVAGECRSGSYMAGSSFYARSLGSKGMGVTSVTVNEDGVIAAHKFYPGVRIRIGSLQMVIEEECYNKKFSVQDGKLVSTQLR